MKRHLKLNSQKGIKKIKNEQINKINKSKNNSGLQIGSFVTGKVKELTNDGLILITSNNMELIVPKIHIKENYVSKNLIKLFPIDKEINGRVFEIDNTCKPEKIYLTLRKSFLSPSFKLLDELSKFKINHHTIGIINSIKNNDLEIRFFNNLKTFIKVDNINLYKIGQLVRVKIINIDNNTIYASLNELNLIDNKKQNSLNTIGQFNEIDKSNEKSSEINDIQLNPIGFNWNFDPKSQNFADISSDEEIENDETLDDNKFEKKREKRKTKTAREYEEYLRKKENDLMDTNREPETKDDFERQLISTPNNSLLWIKYMSMYIEQKLYDKARQIGERALQTITFREEDEKFNVWIAMLNLENQFGNEESFYILYRRAQSQNDHLKLFKSLIKIYTSNEQFKKAEESFSFHLKKLKHLKEYWLDYGLFYFRCNKLDKARSILEQSLKSLDKQDHIDVISKFAQMEFKSGDIERGKTLFENLLSTYPKRVDLWLVYLDVMQKYGRNEEDNNSCVIAIRNIFERLTSIKLKANRMKTIYKRYLEFETKFGNKSSLDRVKEKMKNYVESNPF